jgi:hypothetical protein
LGIALACISSHSNKVLKNTRQILFLNSLEVPSFSGNWGLGFPSTLGPVPLTLSKNMEVVEPPFSNTTWPKDIVSLDCYIRRFIERGELCFERPEFCGQGIALSYLPLGAYKRTIAKVVCEELLAECIVYGARELYLMF